MPFPLFFNTVKYKQLMSGLTSPFALRLFFFFGFSRLNRCQIFFVLLFIKKTFNLCIVCNFDFNEPIFFWIFVHKSRVFVDNLIDLNNTVMCYYIFLKFKSTCQICPSTGARRSAATLTDSIEPIDIPVRNNVPTSGNSICTMSPNSFEAYSVIPTVPLQTKPFFHISKNKNDPMEYTLDSSS